MKKILKIKLLSPLHISNEEYESDFNLFFENKEAYIFDEFKLSKEFIEELITSNNFFIAEDKKEEIIDKKLYKREIKNFFNSSKIKYIISHIDTSYGSFFTPYIPGSSLKGAIRTPFVDYLVNNEKNSIEKAEKKADKIFENLIIRDAIKEDVKSQIYLAVNIKNSFNLQNNRENKEKKFFKYSNYVEVIKKGEEFEVEIIDKTNKLEKLLQYCNDFYEEILKEDKEIYCYKKNSILEKSDNSFLLKLGRFTGCKAKSIRNSKCKSSTVNWGMERFIFDKNFLFQNKLEPFGWIEIRIKDL